MDRELSQRKMTRSEFLRSARNVTAALPLALKGSAGQENKTEPIPAGRIDSDSVTKEMKRLEAAGLGCFKDMYAAQQAMTAAFGSSAKFFPGLSGVLEKVAVGDTAEAESFRSGWGERAKQLKTDAADKAKVISITGAGEREDYVRKVISNVSEEFPVLMMAAPNSIVFTDNLPGSLAGGTNHVSVQLQTRFLDDANSRQYVYTLTHEWGHEFDGGMSLQRIDKIKKYVKMEDFARYTEAYQTAVYRVVHDWAELPYSEAFKDKYGFLAQLPQLNDQNTDTEHYMEVANLWETKLEVMQQSLGIPNEELDEIYKKAGELGLAGPGQKLSRAVLLNLKHDFLTHEYMAKRMRGEQTDDKLFEESVKSVFGETDHYMVGPIHGGGGDLHENEYTWRHEMSVVITNASILEAERIRFLTGSGRFVDRVEYGEKIFGGIYNNGEPPPDWENPGFRPQEAKWNEAKYFEELGVLKEQQRMINQTEHLLTEYRIYSLPPSNRETGNEYFLIGRKGFAVQMTEEPSMDAAICVLPKIDGGWNFVRLDETENIAGRPDIKNGTVVMREGEGVLKLEAINGEAPMSFNTQFLRMREWSEDFNYKPQATPRDVVFAELGPDMIYKLKRYPGAILQGEKDKIVPVVAGQIPEGQIDFYPIGVLKAGNRWYTEPAISICDFGYAGPLGQISKTEDGETMFPMGTVDGVYGRRYILLLKGNTEAGVLGKLDGYMEKANTDRLLINPTGETDVRLVFNMLQNKKVDMFDLALNVVGLVDVDRDINTG